MTDTAAPIQKLPKALPFYLCYTNVFFFIVAAYGGGFWFIPLFLYNFYFLGMFDKLVGLYEANADPDATADHLFWHRLATILWFPTQLAVSFGGLYYTTQVADHTALESWMVMVSAGILMGGMGINVAHEMMHQSPRIERWFADGLMSMTLYGHFRSEHLKVHHRYVGTPRDAVTAKYGETFYKYFRRVVVDGLKSAWQIEEEYLSRKGYPIWHYSNPFWIYGILTLIFLFTAFLLGGVYGLIMYINHAFVAVFMLEVINYVEHYGLTREHLGEGKYEHVKPHHSWNASHKLTNLMLFNLQRHSDHHYKPARRYPLLQSYSDDEAPQLPYGYPTMTIAALAPRLWKSRMNKRVRAWRKKFYPHIEDWTAYNEGTNPMPR